MTPVGHVIYLHGFTSSPNSSKARYFARELEARGVGYFCPDFNEPAFETLTVTRMLEQTARAIREAPETPVALVGSSLGGFVAVHAAARDTLRRVDRLVLLAPAFDFGGNRLKRLGDHGIAEWRRTGRLSVFHWAYGRPQDIGFVLYEDAAAYDAFAVDLSIPTLIVQGSRDETVDAAMVMRWAQGRPTVDLRLVDDEHQLAESMDHIWQESVRVFGL